MQAKDIAPMAAKKTTGIIIDGQNDDVSHEDVDYVVVYYYSVTHGCSV